MHSHGLGMTIGLATQLVQTWGLTVCRDVLALCWSIMAAVQMMTHEEVDTICCSEHVAWDGGASLPQWRAACGDCDRVIDGHGLRLFLMYDIPMRCIPWYGDLGDRWLSRRDMVEMVVLHMLQ